MFSYGSGGFPTTSGGGSGYLVDVVYTPGPDHTPPSVTSTTPKAGETSVSTGSTVSATMSENIQAASAQLTVTGPGGAVGGTVSYSPSTLAVTFTPTVPLAAGTTYTAVLSGAIDSSGNAMASPVSWSFTTSGTAVCPCTLFSSGQVPGMVDSNDANAVEVGTRFTTDTAGWVTGLRFYKSASNTGVHTGTLWDANGNALATGTFSGESASGWQTLTFASAVPVTAGTSYVVSYFAPSGHYSQTQDFFDQAYDNAPLHGPASTVGAPNGVFTYGADVFPVSSFAASNYWVDPVFTTVAPHAQRVSARPHGAAPAATIAMVDQAIAFKPSDEEHPR